MLVVAFLAAGLCFGAANDTILTFSTQGPDTYGDGTTVLDGERYALVWVKGGTTFAGGSFAFYLLDTRVEKTELAKAGKLSVNAIGRVFRDSRNVGDPGDDGDSRDVSDPSDSTDSIVTVGGVASMRASAVALAQVGVYTKIEEPKIATIKVTGEKIEIKVDGMVENHDYFVVPGSSPSDFMPALATKPVGDTFTFDAPKDAPFFKVIGARKFR